MIVCRDLSQHYGLGFVIDRFSDIMKQSHALRHTDVQSELRRHQT